MSSTPEQPLETCELSLADIVIDEAFQVRRKLSRAAVGRYAAKYKNGGELSPLRVARVEGGALILVDGWHRIEALASLGRTRVVVEIVNTTTQGARWEAAKANLTHGVQLTNLEYREVFRAFVKAKQHRKINGRLKSYREVALEIGGTKSHNTIHTWMKKDFPATARVMGGQDGPGGDRPREWAGRHPEAELFDSGVRGAKNASAAARGILNTKMRGLLVEALRNALDTAETAGPYDLTEAGDAF